jgi:hypothetical protein
MVIRAKKLHEQVTKDYEHVLRLQVKVRKEKDLIKLSCVNSKLVELKATMNLVDTAQLSFDSTIGAGADSARASFKELSTNSKDVGRLRAEADGCAGVPELYKQESGTEFTSPEIPDDPLAEHPHNHPFEFEPPAYASPFS